NIIKRQSFFGKFIRPHGGPSFFDDKISESVQTKQKCLLYIQYGITNGFSTFKTPDKKRKSIRNITHIYYLFNEGIAMDKRKIKSFYTFLQSQETAQRFLQHCYRKIQDGQDEQNSYANCTTFMYYLDHGLTFYESGKKLSLLAQPMLFFYGMTHLLKANLLAKRPYYPESTSMLAHGVSTRKRKKKNYAFLDDEVKIQLKGLLPYANDHLFLQKQIPFTKIKM